MNRVLPSLLLYLLILTSPGCNTSTHLTEDTSPNTPLFDPTTSTVPLPNILATATASDPITQYSDPVTGRVGLRPAHTPMNPLEALAYENIYEVGGSNAVAGLNAPIYIRFTAALDPTTVNAANIKVFQISTDSASPTSTENNPLGFADVTGVFSFSYSAGSSDVTLFPKFPLLPATRYLYLVTNRVKDATTGGAVSSSIYFDALKSTSTLAGPFAALEPIRANTPSSGPIVLSGYNKVMTDLTNASATTTVTSRDQIALLGRFITTAGGFIAANPAAPVTSLVPVESALRSFAASVLPLSMSGAPVTLPPQAYWTALVAGTAPATVGAVVTGAINSADISTNPVAVHNNAGSIDLGVAFGTYSAGTAVVQPFRAPGTGLFSGYYFNGVRPVPFVYLTPAGSPPPGGWPLVIFQHGITGRKEEVVAVAGTITKANYAVLAIDLPLHGELAFPGHGSSASTFDLWGQDFISLGAPLAARSNIQQAAFNLDRLELTVAALGFAPLGAALAPNPALKPKYVSLSLGSIVGAYYLAGSTSLNNADLTGPVYSQSSLNGDMKGMLNTVGGRLAYLLRDSVSFGPSIEAGLEAAGIFAGTPASIQFFLLTQSVLDPVDPATMTTPLLNLRSASVLPSRLSGRILVQEATSTQFTNGVPSNGDQTIPNDSTRYFGNALGGRGVLGFDIAPGFQQLSYADGRLPSSFMLALLGPKVAAAASAAAASGPTEGYFQFDQPDVTHSFLINQASSPISIQLAQRQMFYYLLTGLVVDPTVTSAALPKLAVVGATGIDYQVTAPPVMRVLGYPKLR